MFKLLSELSTNENDLLSLSLDEIVRRGAKKLLSAAIQLEVKVHVEKIF